VLVRLLNERARCVCEVGRLKRVHGIEVYQPEREKDVLAHVRSIAVEGPLGPDAVARLFERIIDEARRLERRVVSDRGSDGVHDGVDAADSEETPGQRMGKD
jgi:chorismate mutase